MSFGKETYELLIQINANVEKAVQALQKVTGGMGKTEKQTDSLAKAFTVAAGIMLRDFVRGSMNAVIRAVGQASKSFREYELTLTRIVSATSATGAEAEILAEELASVSEAQTDLGFSARESAEALEALVKAGLSGSEAAEALRASLSLARLEGVATDEAANLLVQTLTVFQMQAGQSAEALNWISRAADAGIGTALDYAGGLSNAGAAAANLGFSLQDTLGALVILDKTFGSAIESGTFLNMLFKDMVLKSDKLGISLYDADGSMRSLDQIVTELKDKVAEFGGNQEAVNKYLSVFDVRAQRAIVGLLNYDGSIRETVGSMTEAREVQEKVNMVMDTSAGKMAKLEARQENVSYRFGEMATQIEIATKEFLLNLGAVGALAYELGPSVLQGAMTGLMVLLPQIISHFKKTLSTTTILGISVKTLGLSIGAAVGAFGGVYSILMSLPPEMRRTASIIAIVTGALIAATAAAVAFWTSISVGTLAPVIIAGVATAIAGVAVHLQGAETAAEDFTDQLQEMAEETEVVTEKTEEMAKSLEEIEKESYEERLNATIEHWAERLKAEASAFDQLVADYNEFYNDMEDAARDSYEKQVADAEEFYESQLGALAVAMDNILEAYGIDLVDQRKETERFYDGALDAVKDHYGDVIEAMEDSLEEQEKLIETRYSDQTEAIKAEYDQRIDDTKAFYDEQIAAINEGLRAIRGERSGELDELELAYLLEKQALESSLSSGQILEEDFQAEMESLEEEYQETRASIREDYRIRELQYELGHAAELERLEQEKSEAIAKEQEALIYRLELNERLKNTEIERLEEKHKTDLEEVNAEKSEALQAVEANLKDKLLEIEEAKNAAILKAETELSAQLADIYEARVEDLSTIYAEIETLTTQHEQAMAEIEAARAKFKFEHSYEGTYQRKAREAHELFAAGEYEKYLNLIGLLESVWGMITPEEAEAARKAVPGAAEGGLYGVTGPQLIRVGEREPELVTPISQLEDLGGGQAITFVFYAPLVNVEAAAVEKGLDAESLAKLLESALSNVVIEATSAEAPETHKRIRVLPAVGINVG